MTTYSITLLDSENIDSHIHSLCDVLENCVSAGASVSFISPLSRAKSTKFWADIAVSVRCNERIVLVAQMPCGEVIGTVQLVIAQPENQPHRADVAKLLVHQKARRQGVASNLMAALEHEARARGKSVLVLDTASGSDAENFYQRDGWQRVGEIPQYALMPNGTVTATTIFYKLI
ncbi:GNAT family N-acetyltransferase [Salmonella enterica]